MGPGSSDKTEPIEDEDISLLLAGFDDRASNDGEDICDLHLDADMRSVADAACDVIEEVVGCDSESMVRSVGNTDLDEVTILLERLLKKDMCSSEIKSYQVLDRVDKRIADYKELLRKRSRTSKLWLSYLEMFHILKISLMAERTGDFSMHLWALKEMLPYFAACGQDFYAKSTRLYLQVMYDLSSTNPLVFAASETASM